jgi:hypothetical protein
VPLAEIEVTLSIRGCGLLVEVADPDRGRLPAPRTEHGPEGDGGLGLVIVAALAERCGCEARPFTKSVWAYFLVPDASGESGCDT